MRFGAAALFVSLLVAGCGILQPDNDEASWHLALEMWERRDVRAYDFWLALAQSPRLGSRVRKRLEQADSFYKSGLDLYEQGQLEQAAEQLQQGAGLAPIHPKYYFFIAQASHQKGMNENAAKYYRRYLLALPHGENAREARTKLDDLNLAPFEALEENSDESESAVRQWSSSRLWSSNRLWVAAYVFAALFLIAFVVVLYRRSRGISLSKVIDRHPHLHAAASGIGQINALI